MELRLKRNSDIIEEGRERAYELIEQNITSFGEDGAPLLVRYRGEDGKLHTIIVIIGPDGAYSTFEDNNHGKTVVTSVDESVRVSGTTDGYDLSILSPEIIEYLNGLFEYKYSFSVISSYTKLINLTDNEDDDTYYTLRVGSSKKNQNGTQSVTVTETVCDIDGWSQDEGDPSVWSIEVKPTEEDYYNAAITIPFKCEATNEDGKTGIVTKNCTINIIRWWFIFEHDENDINEDELNFILDNTEDKRICYKSADKDLPNENIKWTMGSVNYFWILVPAHHSASITQSGRSVVNEPITVNSKHGKYKCYRSLSKNAAVAINDVDIKIV